MKKEGKQKKAEAPAKLRKEQARRLAHAKHTVKVCWRAMVRSAAVLAAVVACSCANPDAGYLAARQAAISSLPPSQRAGAQIELLREAHGLELYRQEQMAAGLQQFADTIQRQQEARQEAVANAVRSLQPVIVVRDY